MSSLYWALRRRKTVRDQVAVLREYATGWSAFSDVLDATRSLEDWLVQTNADTATGYFQLEGRLEYSTFNSSNYYRTVLVSAIKRHFGAIESITEYGCGIGRNLLYLKQQFPTLKCYGYELVSEGVEIARRAAKKFGKDVEYSQLDYLRDGSEKFVFPETDLSFTMFSLEQLPSGCDAALRNMLRRTRLGSIHLEPVPENYPYTLRGWIARVQHHKLGYLSGFPDAVAKQSLKSAVCECMSSSHNPLMFPSMYALKKRVFTESSG